MRTERDNFEAWYAAILEGLYPRRDAGLVIAMVSLPLLERYIRQRMRLPSDANLTDAFHANVFALVPGLRDAAQAKEFWLSCRHGLLHQVSLQNQSKGGAALRPPVLTHDIDCIFTTDGNGNLLLHPVLFAKRVIDLIRSDFATFVGHPEIGPALLKVRPYALPAAQGGHSITVSTAPIITGTSTDR